MIRTIKERVAVSRPQKLFDIRVAAPDLRVQVAGELNSG
jgi:hypothetical protein